jgi:Fe-S-cluster containining protein
MDGMSDDPTRIPVPENASVEEMFKVCQTCRGKCCTYMAVEIDTPSTLSDFENIRWYCAHKNTWVYKEEGAWHVVFEGRCEFLQDDYACSIYEKRPGVCRDYKWGECEYFLRGEFDLEFHTLDEVDEYLRKRFPRHFVKKLKRKKKSQTMSG